MASIPVPNRQNTVILYRIKILEQRIGYYRKFISMYENWTNRVISRIDLAISRIKPPRSTTYLENLKQRYLSDLQKRTAGYNATISALELEIIKLQNSMNPDPRPPSPKPPIPKPDPKTNISKLIVDQTKIAHINMMQFCQDNYTLYDDDFLIPFVPLNLNLKLDRAPGILVSQQAQNDWQGCEFADLGNSKNGSRWYINTYLEIYGYFSNFSYVGKQVYVPPAGILTNDAVTVSLDNAAEMGRYLDKTAINSVMTVIKALNNWAKNTFYLVAPPLCADRYYYEIYGDPVNNTTGTPVKAPPSDMLCADIFEPVCDVINNVTYVNECEARNAHAPKIVEGNCIGMVRARDRLNFSVPQTQTVVPSLFDSKNQVVLMPNALQAEYFNRLYLYMMNAHSTGQHKVIHTLAEWTISKLQNYTLETK